jgi:hypothetical protein
MAHHITLVLLVRIVDSAISWLVTKGTEVVGGQQPLYRKKDVFFTK